jgi:hypothetical protein
MLRSDHRFSSVSKFTPSRTLLGRTIFIIALSSLTALPSCSLFQKLLASAQPEFRINSLRVTELSLESISFHVDSELVNHFAIPLPQSILKLDLKINDKKLTSIQSDPISAKAGSSTPIPFNVKLKYSDLYSVIGSMSLVDAFKFGLHGGADFSIKLPGMPEKITVPFNVEKTVPSFLPDVTIDSVKLRRPDLSSIVGSAFTDEIPLGLDVELTVKNRGGAKFNFENLGYTMLLDGKSVFEGRTTSSEPGLDGKSSKVRISTDLPLKESVRALLPVLKGNAIAYQLKGDLGFKFAGVDLNELKLPLDKKGTIGF